MKNIFRMLFLIPIFFSCRNTGDQNKTHKEYKAEIVSTEKEFEKMAADSGLAVAFSYFVADSGVVQTGDTLIRGKSAVRKHYQQLPVEIVSLKWAPDFVDVSSSGDLGYTYGNFVFSIRDSTGKITDNQGIFHTVWKRQGDGTWRFVWD